MIVCIVVTLGFKAVLSLKLKKSKHLCSNICGVAALWMAYWLMNDLVTYGWLMDDLWMTYGWLMDDLLTYGWLMDDSIHTFWY